MVSRSYPQRVGGAPLKWCRFSLPPALKNSCRQPSGRVVVKPCRLRGYPLRALAAVRMPYLSGCPTYMEGGAGDSVGWQWQ